MSIRERIARWLYPEAFKESDRYRFLLGEVRDLYHWCNYDFPQVGMAADWLMKRVRLHFMSLAEYDALLEKRDFAATNVKGISGFRDQLRDTFKAVDTR